MQPAAQHVVAFPASLSAAQRARLHEAAELAGRFHASEGVDGARRIVVAAAEPSVLEHESVVPDSLLASWAKLHLGLSLPAAASPSANAKRTAPSKPKPGQHAGAQPPLSVDSFVSSTLPLLELEQAAELGAANELHASGGVAAAVARGACLTGLRVLDISPGFLGRTVVSLAPAREGALLPSSKLGSHDLVCLRPSKAGHDAPALARGVVSRVSESRLEIALDEPPEEELGSSLLRVERLANNVTHTRLKEALASLTSAGAGTGAPQPGARLVDILFSRRAPLTPLAGAGGAPTLAAHLDESQARAVQLCLAAPELALIHGPPGTGKTTALVEVVLQAVKRGERVLCCAASNAAVDNLLERLRAASPKLRCVRLGHPARLSPAVLESSLEAAVLRADSSALAADCRKEAKALNTQLAKLGSRQRAERRELRTQLSRLGREERQRSSAAVQEVMQRCSVVAATLSGALSRSLRTAIREAPLDLVVVDEAAQALEAACWGPLLMARRAVLAGDHCQLPPTVLSDEAARGGLSRTLFERAHAMHPPLCAMLTVQYRMNADIADWASGELYGGCLTAPPEVASRSLGQLGAALEPFPVLLFVDTAGCDCEESSGGGAEESRSNAEEARAALAHVRQLVAAGLAPEDIGLITPYSAQVTLLREMRGEALRGVEVSTVDSFQGREKDAIVISCVRSNAAREVGFLADSRRMNVAVTRARRHCALVGDSETLGGDAFLGRLVAWFEARGDVRSAAEYD